MSGTLADNRHAIDGRPPVERAVGPLPGRGRGGESVCMHVDLETLETTFDLVAPRGEELMDIFYARLFAAAPSVKPLFAGTDLRRQKAMLLSALVLVRKSLRDMDAMVPTLRELGARHVGYGAKPEHYPVVGGALLWTLEKGLGEAWTSDVADAWTAAYGTLSGYMISEAYGKAQAAE